MLTALTRYTSEFNLLVLLAKVSYCLVKIFNNSSPKYNTASPIPKSNDAQEIPDDAQEIPDEFYGGAHFILRIASTIERGWNLHQPRQEIHTEVVTFLLQKLISCNEKSRPYSTNSNTEAE
ncbi:hypothetical protein Tco_1201155 [Tanacetum coccineum]